MYAHEKEDAIIATLLVRRVEIGHKQVEDETLYRFVDVFGNEALGYIASSDEYFSPARNGSDVPEFYEVRFQTSIFPTVDAAIADALPSATSEAKDAGYTLYPAPVSEYAPAPAPAPVLTPVSELDPSKFIFTDGYVGSMGKTYETPTAEKLAEIISLAALRNEKTEEEIKELLRSGKAVEWCDSPNHYYDHGKGMIGTPKKSKPVETVKASCGHTIPRSQLMSASMGTSCPDCYDRMSN